jgi:hypothetical protein
MYDLKLSQRLTLIKSSRAVSRASWLKIDVSGTSPHHQILIIGKELVPETSIFNQLTQLIAQEDSIKKFDFNSFCGSVYNQRLLENLATSIS